MWRFQISFNYTREAQRSFLYLMTPTMTTITLIATYLVAEREKFSLSFVFQSYCRRYIRSIICVSISASFAIFMRSLYIRFAALNFLLKYVSFNFQLSFLAHRFSCFQYFVHLYVYLLFN